MSLRAKSLEIPQARADELTASLRTNPFVFGDSQLILTAVTAPPTIRAARRNTTSMSRIRSTFRANALRGCRVAAQARRTVEAQYQDAVRQELDLLFTTYVDVLAARETLRFAQASLDAVNHALALQTKKTGDTLEEKLQDDHIEVHRDAVELSILDAEATYRAAKRSLATVLSFPPDVPDRLELRGSLRDQAPEAPAAAELIPMAMSARPDLAAFRLGVCRALADVRLAQANRFSDVYLLYQPFTYQDNAPLQFAQFDVVGRGRDGDRPDLRPQSREHSPLEVQRRSKPPELQVMERRVWGEVEDARQEYEVSRQFVDRIQNKLLPAARHVRDHSLEMSQRDGGDVYAYLIAQRDFQDLVRQYRDALVRHRRAMLKLNTAVGMRVLP